MSVVRKQAAITTTGGAGVSAGSVDINTGVGEVVAIHLNYHASAPATTDATITAYSTDYPTATLATISDNATDRWVYPSFIPQDASGAAITNAHRPAIVHEGIIRVGLAQCDDLAAACIVTVYLKLLG